MLAEWMDVIALRGDEHWQVWAHRCTPSPTRAAAPDAEARAARCAPTGGRHEPRLARAGGPGALQGALDSEWALKETWPLLSKRRGL